MYMYSMNPFSGKFGIKPNNHQQKPDETIMTNILHQLFYAIRNCFLK